jgi:NADPH:quinone reductase-like Zn-dependent oxidoreductase
LQQPITFDIRLAGANEIDYMFSTKGYAAHSAHEPLKLFSFERREPTPSDVQIEILFCGVCHSDLHIARNECDFTTYPCAPGHEIVGRVVKTGRDWIWRQRLHCYVPASLLARQCGIGT